MDHVDIAPRPIGEQTARGEGFAFVGRGQELDLLLAALQHPPAVVLVEGEAGIGKSRLVHEAASVLTAANGRVLTGLCHPLREPFPFGPVVDALRKAGPWLPALEDIPPSAGALARLLPDLAEWLPAPPPPPGDASAERYQLVHGLRSFLDAVGRAVLVIEDLHWVDEATREMLLLLTRDMPEQLSLVLTYRAEDLPPGGLLGSPFRRQPGTSGIAIHLEPLSEPAVEELARDALGAHATRALGRILYDRSEGLPLVAEEDLITLREHGRHGAADSGADLSADLERAEVPRGLREALTERLAALSPAAAAAVNAAAVLDVDAAEELLIQVAGLEPDEGAQGLTEALAATVLRETDSGRYSFRHVLARQVAYQQMPGPVRSRLHRRAIAVLEAQSPPPLVQIAHHTLMLGDRAAWLVRAEAAADQAIALGDAGTAAKLIHRILEQPSLPGDLRSRAATALAGIAVHGVDTVANTAVLRRILADPQLPTSTRGEIRLSLGLLMINHAGDRAGFREVARAADELADRPSRATRAMISLAMNEQDGESDRAWMWVERADQTLRRSPDVAAAAAVEATRLTLLAREGDPRVWALVERLPRRSENDEILRQTARAVYNVGDLAIELGHDRWAGRLLAESRELARRSSFPHMESYSRIALARLDTLAGGWAEAEKRFADLRREYPDVALAATEQALVLGRLALARGRRSRALELLTTGATYGETETQVTTALRAAAGLAEVRLAEGAPRDAWTIAARAVATLRRAAAWARATGLVPVAVEAALACGDAAEAEAEQLLLDTEEGLQGRDAPGATAELQLARGVLLSAADAAAAAERFEDARQLWSEIGRPYDTARAAERRAVALAATGRGPAAAQLAEAVAVYEGLGAAYDLARAQRLGRELGLVEPAPRGRRGYGGELSPRERQVAELVGRGATNQDIAQALFLSPRTVEQHVARLLRKLGVTRAEVAEVLESQRSR